MLDHDKPRIRDYYRARVTDTNRFVGANALCLTASAEIAYGMLQPYNDRLWAADVLLSCVVGMKYYFLAIPKHSRKAGAYQQEIRDSTSEPVDMMQLPDKSRVMFWSGQPSEATSDEARNTYLLRLKELGKIAEKHRLETILVEPSTGSRAILGDPVAAKQWFEQHGSDLPDVLADGEKILPDELHVLSREDIDKLRILLPGSAVGDILAKLESSTDERLQRLVKSIRAKTGNIGLPDVDDELKKNIDSIILLELTCRLEAELGVQSHRTSLSENPTGRAHARPNVWIGQGGQVAKSAADGEETVFLGISNLSELTPYGDREQLAEIIDNLDVSNTKDATKLLALLWTELKQTTPDGTAETLQETLESDDELAASRRLTPYQKLRRARKRRKAHDKYQLRRFAKYPVLGAVALGLLHSANVQYADYTASYKDLPASAKPSLTAYMGLQTPGSYPALGLHHGINAADELNTAFLEALPFRAYTPPSLNVSGEIGDAPVSLVELEITTHNGADASGMWIKDVANVLQKGESKLEASQNTSITGWQTYPYHYNYDNEPYIEVQYPIHPKQALPILEDWKIATVSTLNGAKISFKVGQNGMRYFPYDIRRGEGADWVTYTLVKNPTDNVDDSARADPYMQVRSDDHVTYDYLSADGTDPRKQISTYYSIKSKEYDNTPLDDKPLPTNASTLELFNSLQQNPKANCNTAATESVLNELIEKWGRADNNLVVGAVNPEQDNGKRMNPHMKLIDRRGATTDPTPSSRAGLDMPGSGMGNLLPYAGLAAIALGVTRSGRSRSKKNSYNLAPTTADTRRSRKIEGYAGHYDVRQLIQAYNLLAYGNRKQVDINDLGGGYDPKQFISTHQGLDVEHIRQVLAEGGVKHDENTLRRLSKLLNSQRPATPATTK